MGIRSRIVGQRSDRNQSDLCFKMAAWNPTPCCQNFFAGDYLDRILSGQYNPPRAFSCLNLIARRYLGNPARATLRETEQSTTCYTKRPAAPQSTIANQCRN